MKIRPGPLTVKTANYLNEVLARILPTLEQRPEQIPAAEFWGGGLHQEGVLPRWQDTPIWAVVTAGPDGDGFYTWGEIVPGGDPHDDSVNSWRTRDDGMSGTPTLNPLYEPNGVTIEVDTRLRIVPTYFHPDQGWVYAPAGSVGEVSTFHGFSISTGQMDRITLSSGSNNITFTEHDYDTDGFHDFLTNPTRITIPTSLYGRWRIGVQVNIVPPGADGVFSVFFGYAANGVYPTNDPETRYKHYSDAVYLNSSLRSALTLYNAGEIQILVDDGVGFGGGNTWMNCIVSQPSGTISAFVRVWGEYLGPLYLGIKSAIIDTTGEILTVVFNKLVDGHDGYTIDPSGGAAGLTYSSGDGTATITFDIDRVILDAETVSLTYTPGDTVNDGVVPPLTESLPETTAMDVINNSTQV